ncbi:MAG: bifunctional DNA-formamidopyrimidine glycosylase/DNA-(apurinic or apyrimidinic site) lyase [Rhodospirillales bacterium]|jgi:formamidopyrimidine-DNA glycosylase|nr:bifunctional DNA-formamidopyrimidine glycosylase/DNA-(apurinic or apyrimidinic site) lyase [Rhodospirillales bacterium]
MPELPEVETVRRGLAPVLEGRRLVRVTAARADLRLPLPVDLAQRLSGRRITAVGRRGKYLLVHSEGGAVLVVHLGMTGRMKVFTGAAPPPEPHDHVVFETEGGATIRYCDPRRFGLMVLAEEEGLADHPLLARLGPEPLGGEFHGALLGARLAGRSGPIKTVLMDQGVVAGLGNIYVCESLFRAGLSPRRKASTVRARRAERLAEAVKAVLIEAIAAGGSSLRDHRRPSGELGYFQHGFAAYGREGEPCPRCAGDGLDGAAGGGGRIRRIVQAGRSTFYCATHQR